MDANDIDSLLRKWRKKTLWSALTTETNTIQLDFEREAIEKLLPHRHPFLLCDKLLRFANVGLPASPIGLLQGMRHIAPDDPVFAGHFPDFPVYPGVLQLEMLGQVALCLAYFQDCAAKLSSSAKQIKAPASPLAMNVRASKVLGAYYLHPVLPNSYVELQACQLGESDGFFARMLGQVVVDNQVATVCAQEVCFA